MEDNSESTENSLSCPIQGSSSAGLSRVSSIISRRSYSSRSSNSNLTTLDNILKLSPKCELNSKGCVSLCSIQRSFSAPINEEHAWALCHQFAKCGQSVLNSQDKDLVHLVTESDHLILSKDGQMNSDTFLGTSQDKDGPPRPKCNSESKLIYNLALVIFEALNYGLGEDEERHLSPDLESLLEAMNSADDSDGRHETDDEGIERDSGDSDDDNRGSSQRTFNFDSIVELCIRRLGSSTLGHLTNSSSNSTNSTNSSSTAADSHYKAVCRALVAESVELSTFLQRVSQGTKQFRQSTNSTSGSSSNSNCRSETTDPDLDQLNFNDWARLWIQVVSDLRNGVKLKKVDHCERGPPIEFELTPYEILMDDIRSRRYRLNKVMVDGELPQRVKKNAHDLILDFIRSRPPLKKAADRILGPPPCKKPNPIELLMESIRQTNSERLKPIRRDSIRTRGRKIHHSNSTSNDLTDLQQSLNQSIKSSQNYNNDLMTTSTTTVSGTSISSKPKTTRSSSRSKLKMDAVDGQQLECTNGDLPQRRLIKPDLDFLYSLDNKDESEDSDDLNDDHKENDFYGHMIPEETQSTPVTPYKKPGSGALDSINGNGLDSRRRHSISTTSEQPNTMITFPFEYTNNTTCNAFNSLHYSKISPVLQRRRAKLSHSVSKSSLQDEFFHSNQWQTAIECLSLNLEEVVHIRNVLTKAELESLPVDCSLKEDVTKGKVCFLCMKTRFSLFSWGNNCRLCKQVVCSKCCTKMRIPTENFAKIPVSSLSPILSPRDEEKELFPGSKSLSLSPTPRLDSLGNQSSESNRVSAPNSPNLSRRSGSSDTSGQRSISPSSGGCLHDELMDHDEHDEAHDQFPTGPIHSHNQPRSLPTITSLSMGLMAFKKRIVNDKTDRSRIVLMVVCHDCRAMMSEIKRAANGSTPLPPTLKNNSFNSMMASPNNNVDLEVDMTF